MTRRFLAAMRRANRLMRPARLNKATRTLQTAMTGLMVKSALAPMTAVTPKPARKRKAEHPLSTVLRQLRAARLMMPGLTPRQPAPAIAPRIPVGAQYTSRTHRSVHGSRGYKLYKPSTTARPKGLILMLHGCNQTPDDFAIGTRMNTLAERHGLAVAWPAQTGRHNAAACWNWFKPGDQGRGAGEPAALAALATKLAREFELGRDSVFVAGLSAGGAMAAILADVYPDVFAAAGIHSGLARGAASDVVSGLAAMREGGTTGPAAPAGAPKAKPVRRIVFQGEGDSTVHPSNAGLIVAAAVGHAATPAKITRRSVRGRDYARSDYAATAGSGVLELWMIRGTGHAWSGGRATGSYTDTSGPDASAQMMRFFLTKPA